MAEAASQKQLTDIDAYWCDCGNPKKARWIKMCRRCQYLDGWGSSKNIVAALRDLGGTATSRDLRDHTGISRRQLERILPRLCGQGRIRRYWVEGETVDWHNGGLQNTGCYAYTLSGEYRGSI